MSLAAAMGLTPFTEPVLSAVEPLLRVLVDMGYTDRLNLDPGDADTVLVHHPAAQDPRGPRRDTRRARRRGLTNLLNGGQIAISPPART